MTIRANQFGALVARRLYRWSARPYVVVALGLLVAVPSAFAQHNEQTYSLVVQGIPLSTALEALVHQTRIDLAYDPPIVRDKRTSCALERATAEELLKCVLSGTGLDFYRLSSGLYVVIPTPETRPLYGGVRGIVLDAETRQPLPRSHVMLADRIGGTTANDAGMFSFSRLPPGEYVVIASHVGYEAASAIVEVPPGGHTEAEIELASNPVLVQPIVVDGLEWRLPSSSLGAGSLSRNDLTDNPSGGSDVLVGLNSLLGVRVSDATADVHVQGGETGEHQLRLDGAPVFLPLNFASFVGPFSPFAIGSITVHKAGFGAAEGSQIAGVIDVRHDVNFDEKRLLDVQVDPLSVNARVSLSGGDPGGIRTAFTAAARTSLWSVYAPPPLQSLLSQWNTPDPFLYTLFDRSTDNPRFDDVDTTTGNPLIGFRDLHAATRIRFGALKSIHASAYFGQTLLGSDITEHDLGMQPPNLPNGLSAAGYRDRYAWDTGIGQARYEVVLGSRVLANFGVRGSYYRVSHDYSVPDSIETAGNLGEDPNPMLERIDDGNTIYEIAAQTHIDYALNARNNLSSGLELIQTGSRFDVLGTQQYPIHHRSSSWRAAAFLEDEVTMTKRITAEIGSRATYLSSRRTTFLEPRAAVRYDRPHSIIGAFSARLSTGLYRQFINQFDVSSRSPRALVSSTRFWLAADHTVSPPSATHYAAEFLLKPTEDWSLRVETYYKDQDHILAVNYGTAAGEVVEDMAQEDFLRTSHGSVKGAGLLLGRSLGANQVKLRYEYNVAERKSDSLYAGQSKYAPWNEPHRIELALDLVPFENMTLLARWRGVWGRTWGFRQAYYDFIGAYNQIAPDLHPDLTDKAQRQIDRYRLNHPEQHRLPPIYQLDLSAAYTMQLWNSRLQLRCDVLNVLNRLNVAEWHLIFDSDTYHSTGEEAGFLQRDERALLPRLLSVAVRWTW